MENRLASHDPPLPLTKAFLMAEVIKVAEKLFERNRFDFNLVDSDSDLPELGDDHSSSGDDSDTEDSDDEKDRKKDKHKQRKRSSHISSESDTEAEVTTSKKTHKPAVKATPPVKETKKPVGDKPAKGGSQDDVEQLIKQLGKMSLDDPKYGLIYYKAIKLDAAVAQCVPSPSIKACSPVTSGNLVRTPYPAPGNRPPSSNEFSSCRFSPTHDMLWVRTARAWPAHLPGTARHAQCRNIGQGSCRKNHLLGLSTGQTGAQ